MSFSAVRTYFRDKLTALDYQEWEDVFNVENIPRTRLKKAFHLGGVRVVGGSLNHRHLETTCTIQVDLFFRGFRTPADALDEAVAASETIVKSALLPSDRVTGSIKNLNMRDIDHFPLAASNDNTVRTEIIFECDVSLDITGG